LKDFVTESEIDAKPRQMKN